MSRSRFHVKLRLNLDMHGLILEINTSVQAGSTRYLQTLISLPKHADTHPKTTSYKTGTKKKKHKNSYYQPHTHRPIKKFQHPRRERRKQQFFKKTYCFKPVFSHLSLIFRFLPSF